MSALRSRCRLGSGSTTIGNGEHVVTGAPARGVANGLALLGDQGRMVTIQADPESRRRAAWKPPQTMS